jgi:NADH-quinone oxidoreductase subunit I
MRLGDTEKDYYLSGLDNPGTSAGAEHAPGHVSPVGKLPGERRKAHTS